MRKELVVFVETTEKGIESSFRILKGYKDHVMIEHEGHKFAVKAEDLKTALFELQFFYTSNPIETPEFESPSEQSFDVEYGE